MKILVAIASYGHNNDQYLARLLREYRGMPHDIDIVVVSNVPKDLGPDVEVIVGLPDPNPWTLPFAHKPVFVERADRYDLFIYSEDDTLITQDNIDAFLWAESILPPGEIAGFLRTEQAEDGTVYYSTVHGHYHWDARSVRRRDGEVFAFYTNEHGACYMLTQAQLKRAIASGGFAVGPHEGKYDLLVSAATDPYTQCGMEKLICVSRIERFLCKHLTNKYIGKTGVRSEFVDVQLKALVQIGLGQLQAPAPLPTATRLPGTRWTKSYYEGRRQDMIDMVPASATKVLSIGCGWGETELALQQRGLAITAVPIDVVIGQLAALRGVHIVPCGLDGLQAALRGQSFDVVLLPDMLHLVDAPVDLLRCCSELLVPGGRLLVSFPNMRNAAIWRRRLLRDPTVQDLTERDRSGVHVTSMSTVKRWLREAGFAFDRATPQFTGRWRRYHDATLGALTGLWASDFTLGAIRSGGTGASRVHEEVDSSSTSSAGVEPRSLVTPASTGKTQRRRESVETVEISTHR
jgi:2-polyprenyl-3-methyl-5-hydroxy-6-metoxy-1,4-benzoquinol methylase